MKPLQREAIAITKELRNVVFVGAVAVLSYLGWRHRTTRDLDIAMATKLDKPQLKLQLEKLGYITYQEGGKDVVRSPRRWRIDIYTTDVSDISIDTIYSTAREVMLGKDEIKVASLEVMLVAKLRAMRPSRPQDTEDFNRLCETNGKHVEWKVLNDIATEIESSTIRESIRALAR